jgi:hypothetical protein
MFGAAPNCEAFAFDGKGDCGPRHIFGAYAAAPSKTINLVGFLFRW